MAKAVGHGLGIGLANGGDKAVRRQGINLPVAEIGLADGWGLGNSRWEGWVLRPWRSTGGGVLAQPDLLCCIMLFGKVWEESPAVQHVTQEVRHWIVPGRSSGPSPGPSVQPVPTVHEASISTHSFSTSRKCCSAS